MESAFANNETPNPSSTDVMTRTGELVRPGPRAFYEQAHPELFSDSTVTYEVPLTEELFDLQMDLLSTKKKQAEFEQFAVAVAARRISPNIKPQTGPDGGGDGKIDAETYEVSQDISNKWFSEETGAAGPEKWAFAFSCKKQWREKIAADIEKIVETQRGYSRILFFSNQYIKADTRIKTEETLSATYGVTVTIFDRNWFVMAVFQQGCLDLALDKLEFSEQYKKCTKTIGPNDLQRLKELDSIEKSILRPIVGLNTAYVDQLSKTCILCRELERPRSEIEGHFRRALDECERHGTDQQMFNIIYQHGWTCHFWFEDFEAAFQDYLRLRQYVLDNCSVYRLEHALNLLSVLSTASATGFFSSEKIKPEVDFFNKLENTLASDKSRKSCTLYLRLRRSQYSLSMHLARKQPIQEDLVALRGLVNEASGNLDISFQSIYDIVEMLSNQIDNNPDFDHFVDELSDKIASQRSEVEAARVRLSRGAKHFKARRWKEAIRHLSFCVYAFEKEEGVRELIESSILMGSALWELKLPYSAEAFFIKATGFLMKEFGDSGHIPHLLVETLNQLCEIELLLGRLTMYLAWHEMLMIMARNAQVDENQEFIKRRNLEDAAWASRFAASDISDPVFAKLPDVLARQGLWFSSEYLKHALGYREMVDPIFYKAINLDDGDRVLLDQPVFKQFLCELNISQNDMAHLETTINSFTFHIDHPNDCLAQQIAETLLASMEALMATYDNLDLFVLHSSIYVHIAYSDDPTELKALAEVDRYEFRINKSMLSLDDFWKCLMAFIAYVFSRNALVRGNEIAELLERKQYGERMMDRVSVLLHTDAAMALTLGKPFKNKIENWTKSSDMAYACKMKLPSRPNIEYRNILQEKSTTHLINKDMTVWDAAGWKGCAVYADANIPLAFGLMFENEAKGRAIFEEWKKKYSDATLPIRVIILKGIDADNPLWYRLCVTSDLSMLRKDGNGNRCLAFVGRDQTMKPKTNKNILFLERAFSKFGHCRLAPMFLEAQEQLKMPIDFSLSFDFSKLTIMDAWKVEPNSEFICALAPDDNPAIPPDRQQDAPVLKALAQLRSLVRAKDAAATK